VADRHTATPLAFPAGNRLLQPVRQPELNQRLAGDAQPLCLPVEGLHHPNWEVDINPLGLVTDPPRFA